MKSKILFVCIHNSARSVMAEAFVNHLYGDRFEARSAGIEPGKLNPIVAQAMAEIGIDVSEHQPRSVADVIQSGQEFARVITVCDETSAERCPIFPLPQRRRTPALGLPRPFGFARHAGGKARGHARHPRPHQGAHRARVLRSAPRIGCVESTLSLWVKAQVLKASTWAFRLLDNRPDNRPEGVGCDTSFMKSFLRFVPLGGCGCGVDL